MTTPMKNVRGTTGLLCYSLQPRQHPSTHLAHPQSVPVSHQPSGVGYIQHYEAMGSLQVSPQTEGSQPGGVPHFVRCRNTTRLTVGCEGDALEAEEVRIRVVRGGASMENPRGMGIQRARDM